MTTIKVYTAPGTNASNIGESYGAYDGVTWRNAVDRVNSDGTGIVFLDCEDDTGEWLLSHLDADEGVESYEY